jgi:hypothetical protein
MTLWAVAHDRVTTLLTLFDECSGDDCTVLVAGDTPDPITLPLVLVACAAILVIGTVMGSRTR